MLLDSKRGDKRFEPGTFQIQVRSVNAFANMFGGSALNKCVCSTPERHKNHIASRATVSLSALGLLGRVLT
jgi:hypothetical protein